MINIYYHLFNDLMKTNIEMNKEKRDDDRDGKSPK